MKLNSKKIAITAMMSTIAAALIGGISGTVAWYQYSTKVTGAFVGTSAGTTNNLEIRLNDGTKQTAWATQLNAKTIAGFLAETSYGYSKDGKLTPITPNDSADRAANAALPTSTPFVGNPVYGYAATENWIPAKVTDYVVLPFEFRFAQRTSATNATMLEKDVFLTNVTIQGHANADATAKAKNDEIAKAVRVHISGNSKNALVAKTAGDTEISGTLDMNNDGIIDKAGTNYNFDTSNAGANESTGTTDIVYGANGKKQTAYGEGSAAATEKEPYAKDEKGVLSGANVFAKTVAAADAALTDTSGVSGKVNVTIWLEGWQVVDKAYSTVQSGDPLAPVASSTWKLAETISAMVDVGLEFGCSREVAA